METQTPFGSTVDTTEGVMNFSQSTTLSLKTNTGIRPFLIATASILIIICITGLVGNLFVIVAVSLSRRLQTPTNAFVVTLSCVDLMSALLLPFHSAALLGAADAHGHFSVVCEVVAAITCVVNFWSFSLLVVIAFSRYFVITRPSQKYQTLFSKRKVAGIIVVVLAIPLVMLVAFLCAGAVHFGSHYNLCGVVKGHLYNYLFGASTLTSMAAMAFCYIGIYCHVRSHVQKVQNNIGPVRMQASVQQVQALSPNSVRRRAKGGERRQLDEQITKNLFLVVFCFFVCLAPITVTFFTMINPIMIVVFFVIMSLSYCVNPIIYACRHPLFRKVFRSMISRRLEDIEDPSPWLRKKLAPKT